MKQLEHTIKLQLHETHCCSSHSKADIHNSRWFSVSAPLWTRCWCPQLSGRTWGPLWWPRPPPGTWVVWAEGWCPKAFWGSRRAIYASRWEERTKGDGFIRKGEEKKRRELAKLVYAWITQESFLAKPGKSVLCVPQRAALGAPAAPLMYSTKIIILHWPCVLHNNSVKDTKPKWLVLQLLYTMHRATPIIGV